MTANELADELIEVASVAKPTDDGVTYGLAGYCIKAATMLRQHQAEIEALKEELIMEEESYILLNEECLFAKEAIKLHQAEIEALKAEKIRAYDNGYEDGRKPNTNKAQEK